MKIDRNFLTRKVFDNDKRALHIPFSATQTYIQFDK